MEDSVDRNDDERWMVSDTETQESGYLLLYADKTPHHL
jgi:hypothetical protein